MVGGGGLGCASELGEGRRLVPADMLVCLASRMSACFVAVDIGVPGDPADSEYCCFPQGNDELTDVGDAWTVGFGLPLANTYVEGILVVDEQVKVPRRASGLWVGPGQGVCEGLPESVELGDDV